jgi:hypothetical protein
VLTELYALRDVHVVILLALTPCSGLNPHWITFVYILKLYVTDGSSKMSESLGLSPQSLCSYPL